MKRSLRSLDAASRDQLREQAMSLKEAGYDYASIGSRLHVTPIIARDLCLHHRRSVRRQLNGAGFVFLPQAVVDVLVGGPHAVFVASTKATRIKYLAKICSLYTRAELFRERRVGRATLGRIENWLVAQGYRLRGPDELIAEAVCWIRHQERRCVRWTSWQLVAETPLGSLVPDQTSAHPKDHAPT